MPHRFDFVLVIGLCLGLAAPPGAGGQARESTGSEPCSISGLVLDAETSRPLPSAMVVVRAEGPGVEDADGGRRPGRDLATLTDGRGRYCLAHLQPGKYRLQVRSVGYRSASVGLSIGERLEAVLSVGLDVAPVALEPVHLRLGASMDGDASGWGVSTGGEARLARERARQATYLGSDVRVVTAAEMRESIGFVEEDLFRTLQRMPGTAFRDDYSAKLWIRGAPWDQVAVHFDGVPLFNPLHSVGAFSGFSSDAVARAAFHPGVAPPELRSGAAGAIDIRSRRGGGAGIRGSAEASLLSGRLSLGGGLPVEGGSWMLTARRSHVDLAPLGVARLLGSSAARVPYAFADATGRVDLPVTERTEIRLSALHHWDDLRGTVPGLVVDTNARWGATAARVAAVTSLAGREVSHSLGVSHSFGRAAEREPPPPLRACRCSDGYYPAWGEYRAQPLTSRISQVFLGSAWELRDADGEQGWTAGYRLTRMEAAHETSGLWPYRTVPRGPEAADRRMDSAVAWALRAIRPMPGLRLEAGLRGEITPALGRGELARAAPQLAARLALVPGTSVSASAARTHQHAQAIVPAGPGANAVALSQQLWVLSDPDTPPLTADLATLGLEHWLGRATLLSATAYRRAARGLAVPDPRPGWMADRPLFVGATGRASGLDLSLRHLGSRWTGSVAYSRVRSLLEVDGLRYRPSHLRPHSGHALASVRLPGSVQFGAAASVASGTPFTRYESTLRGCASPTSPCEYLTYGREPGAETAPAHRRLDLAARWSGEVRSVRVAAYAQLHNALGRDNVGVYQWSSTLCSPGPTGGCMEPDPDPGAALPENDHFLTGLPRTPVFGARIAF